MNQAPLAQRIAVIGSGISGLGAAYLLGQRHHVVLYEADRRLGGHANTVDANVGGRSLPVDTGFIVYNPLNYPNLCALFDRLSVPSEQSEMSFSVSVGGGVLEWAGANLATLFAQPSNMLSPRFHGMWRDILRFNRRASSDLACGRIGLRSLGEYLIDGGYGEAFILDYLLPMGAAIWSAPMVEMQRFPARAFVRFFVNHGLLSVNDRPAWRTVSAGSREYVRRLVAASRMEIRAGTPVREVRRHAGGVELRDATGRQERFDHVVMAGHADDSLRLLADPTTAERSLLSAFAFQRNEVVLHADPALMPRRRRVWSSWNYLTERRRDMDRRVSLTYWMNRLQNIDNRFPLFVTMNPLHNPDPAKTFAHFTYQHPLFDQRAIAAQAMMGDIQGVSRTWFCGAWTRYGFHEDGLRSAIAVARSLGVEPGWESDVPAYRQSTPSIVLRAAE